MQSLRELALHMNSCDPLRPITVREASQTTQVTHKGIT